MAEIGGVARTLGRSCSGQRDGGTGAWNATNTNWTQITGTNTLDGIVGHGAELRASWESLNLSRQAAIVAAVLDYATITPGNGGGRREVDPNRIIATWRL